MSENPKAYDPRPGWSVEDIMTAANGNLLFPGRRGLSDETGNPSFSNICIDSRKVEPGDLFVAIKGERLDGHEFIKGALEKGCRGILVMKEMAERLPVAEWKRAGAACIAVSDTTIALGDLAAYHRGRCPASVVGITGSNGKTTTRKMTFAVLGSKFQTLGTRGNFNNQIGLPLTLFNLRPEHQWAVLELGMNAFGEIDRLGEICGPDIGIITNIGPAHLEGVGSLDGVMRAKGELLGRIREKGTAVLNRDDPRCLKLAQNQTGKILFFGFSEAAQVRAEEIRETLEGTSFRLILPDGAAEAALKAKGRFMISNALAASAAGWLAGMNPDEIAFGINQFEPVQGRMNLRTSPRGIRIIDDTYNANPGSMAAALQTLKSLRGNARGFFVAGDMFELGKEGPSLHHEVGKIAGESGISGLFAVGKLAPRLAAGASEAGMAPHTLFTGNHQEIIEAIGSLLAPGDWVLVKGSRAMRMEQVVQSLMKDRIEEITD